MKNCLLLVTATIGVFSLMVSGEPGVTYYVKPSQSTECPGQPCETLSYYMKNVNTTINQEKNLTMIFLNGNHSLYFEIRTANPTIKTAVIRMIGENNNVSIKALSVSGYSGLEYCMSFLNNNDVSLQNLVVIDFKIVVTSNQPKSTLHMSSLKILNFILDIGIEVYMETTELDNVYINLEALSVIKECKYRNVSIQMSSSIRLEIENCNFSNTPFFIYKTVTVIVSGTTIFADTFQSPAISSFYGGNLTLSGNVTFANNNAKRGGALALYFSTVYIAANTSVTFLNNFASHKGGAIYVEPGISPNVILNLRYTYTDFETIPCFYHLLNCDKKNTYNFNFTNNLATNGGDDIYGDILTNHSCSNCNLTVSFASSSNSSVSSDALRVCMCDSNGRPQCKDSKYNYIVSKIHAGEIFKISAVLVGGDFGLTTGTIHADIDPGRYDSIPASLTQISQYSNLVTDIRQCKDIEYSLYPNDNSQVIVIFQSTSLNLDAAQWYCIDDSCSQISTVFMTFTILPCPPGFNLTGNPPRCNCSDVLTRYLKISCQIINGEGNFMWTGNPWMNISENNDTVYTENCPHYYCKNFNGTEKINLQNDSAYQCELNRRGRLCGRCKEGYSLAIGSSNCIHCVNNNNLALLIFFAAAGILLVLFVGLLNLTVTTGTLSGLIFYANIIWTYKDVFFECEGLSCTGLIFLKTFIAWVNLDFGIETCFVKGLTAFWKTWLQFIFPFYLWAITGLIILASRYSFRLTKLLGNRAVPLLATLILLSYMKLVRTVVSILEFSVISTLPFDGSTKVSSEIVWSVDGSLSYFDIPHVFLFVAGLFTLLFLWLPYTLLLFLMQWLRRLPHVGIIKWIMRLHPFYDSYFAPLKPKHQYWFGVLLLARGILLVTFASGYAIPANVNLFLILVFATLLSVFMARIHPYKNRATLLLNGSYILNLTLLSGFFIFTRTQPDGATLRPVAIGLSMGVTFLQFCGSVLTAIIKPCCFKSKNPLELTIPGNDRSGLDTSSSWYRDSILNDASAEPLLPTH